MIFYLGSRDDNQVQIWDDKDGLAERLQSVGVTVNRVRVTNVAIHDDRLVHLPTLLGKIYQLKRNMSIAPERQAETYVYLAADPAVKKIKRGLLGRKNRQTWNRLWK